ncbi:MAG: FAD-dependent monooxygenase [Coriobacteriia bacterium]|nr:FAD-dependent monooxygenase [Coriobacteriia bacterium]
MDPLAIKNHYRTIVVGTGPAGAMAALHAAARGPVLMIDSFALPRDKSCGGMLNEYSQEFLSAYGKLPEGLWLEPAWVNFRYYDWDRGIKKPTQLRFANVDRSLFDAWMLSLMPDNVDIAGKTSLVTFTQSEKQVDAVLSAAGTEVKVSADNLIGCDGPRSTTRRILGSGSVANYVTLQDFCRLEAPIEPFFDCIYTRKIGDSFAYAYVVPKGEVAIAGSVFYPKTKRPHEIQEQVLEVLRSRLPLGESVKREAWVALSVRNHSDVSPGQGRVLLAGEAGGFMSPSSGEGISYALNSGHLAGRAVAEAGPEAGAETALAAYTQATAGIAKNITHKLKWLPFMESRAGKYLAGFVPTPIVSKITEGL